jgi:hypothetical protein
MSKRQRTTPEREELRAVVHQLRVTAQGDFQADVERLITEIRRFAGAAEKALGEISVDEAWTGVRRTIDAFFRGGHDD